MPGVFIPLPDRLARRLGARNDAGCIEWLGRTQDSHQADPSGSVSPSAFTPGPWEIVEYGDGDSLVIHDGGHDFRICFMATPGSSPQAKRQIEANACLIAAAPDLLEALSDLLEACGPEHQCRNWAWQERQNARAAISKATSNTGAGNGE